MTIVCSFNMGSTITLFIVIFKGSNFQTIHNLKNSPIFVFQTYFLCMII